MYAQIPFVLVFLLFTSSVNAVDREKTTCEKALMIVKTAGKFHYSPKDVDDAFSEFVFEEVFTTMDPERLFFSQEDYTELLKFKTTLDEDILDQKCEFIVAVAKHFKASLVFTDSILEYMVADKFDLTKTDSITFRKEQPMFSRDELVDRWTKWIKLEILRTYYRQNDSVTDLKAPTKEQMEKLLKQVKERETCRIASMLKYEGDIEYYVDQVFLYAVSIAYDPHTMYFSQETNTAFNLRLSKEKPSFGIEVDRNEYGQIVIAGLVPGGPAWNSNEMNEGDIILSVEEGAYITEFICVEWSEVDDFLQGEDIDRATFNIQKMNGKLIQVELKKEMIDVEKNVIQSFIMEGDKKIGYIYVPSFYTEMNTVDYLPNGCANDVAKELIKLKREGIDGLVLDLRNNGGGSMLEAVRLSGIFIDYGAVAIYDEIDSEPQTLKDMNRGLIYADPLIIMINGYSASASEFFAAAMQDQNRAVIVGSKSYGKSTSQTIIPLDSYMYETPPSSKNKSGDFIKLTMGKFFRVTGKSHQKEGIIPDIKLPDRYDKIEFGESEYPNALKATTIDKKTYYYPSEALPIAELKAKSQGRIDNDAEFANVIANAEWLAGRQIAYTVPLEFGAFTNYSSSVEERRDVKVLETDTTDTTVTYLVKNPSYISGISSFSNSDREINADLMESIKNDMYIRESFRIISDLISLSK